MREQRQRGWIYKEEAHPAAEVLDRISDKIPTAQDGGATRESVEGFLQMAANGIFKIDVIAYVISDEKGIEELLREHPEAAGRYTNLIILARFIPASNEPSDCFQAFGDCHEGRCVPVAHVKR